MRVISAKCVSGVTLRVLDPTERPRVAVALVGLIDAAERTGEKATAAAEDRRTDAIIRTSA